jgi:hypothetical protein
MVLLQESYIRLAGDRFNDFAKQDIAPVIVAELFAGLKL